jgi:hypothetical protein
MALRRTFSSKREEVTGEWRKLHNEEFNELYCSPNIFRVMRSRIMRWAGLVGRVWGERRGVYSARCGNLEGKDHLEDPDLEGRIILRWIVRKWDVGIWTGLIWLRTKDRWWAILNALMNFRIP